VPIACINPYGFDYITYLWFALRMPRTMISEWNPLWVSSEALVAVSLWGASVFLLVLLIAKRPRSRWSESLFLVLAAIMALLHGRHASLYGVCFLALVPPMARRLHFFRGVERNAHLHRRFIQHASLTASGVCLVVLIALRCWHVPPSSGIPVGVSEYMTRHKCSGRVFTPFESGAYLAWEQGPRIKISLDSRYEVAYPVEQADRLIWCYLAAPGWARTLQEYPADWIVLPKGYPLTQCLVPSAPAISETGHDVSGNDDPPIQKARMDWAPVYEDEHFILCRRIE
jgi:hypothetical protein